MKKITMFICLLLVNLVQAQNKLSDGLYAVFQTDKGEIITQLEFHKTPLTVANFVALAEGNHPKVEAKYKGKKFYDGLKFHRVVSDFMIQGGDPEGNGSGNPGYLFEDEIVPDLKHDKPGILSMANRGPATNGSQFFITHKETPHLDGRHTIFGHVVKGQEVVDAIQQNDLIQEVTILREGKEAKRFNAPKTFTAIEAKMKKEAEEKKVAAAKAVQANLIWFEEAKAKAITTEKGVKVYVFEKGTSEKPVNGTQVLLDYAGFLTNGELFDSGIESIAKKFNKWDAQRQAANAYKPLPFIYGSKQGMIPGFIEGVEQMNYGDKALVFIPAELGYGSRGIGPIPANSDLIFEIHLVKNN